MLGAAGQLGRDLAPLLRERFGAVRELSRADIDLERPETSREFFAANRPAWFVNCAAYNLVDKAEADPIPAFGANAWGVRHLAEACAAIDCRLLHFSTDYVFGLQTRSTPWAETDAPGPVSEYGRSKLRGEYAVLTASPTNLVVRTCGLYGVWGSGGKGTNFVETMLRLAGQGKPLKVVADQVCTPTATADLARAAVELMGVDAAGLFHATNAGATSWHDFAAEIFRQANVAADLSPTTSAAYGAAARRPAYSVLDCGRLARAGVTPLTEWHSALAAYLAARESRVSD